MSSDLRTAPPAPLTAVSAPGTAQAGPGADAPEARGPGTPAGPTPCAVLHNEAAHRFECTVEGHLCVLDYVLNGSVAAFVHTGVPAAVGGRGIAANLVRAGLETARARGWTVQPVCSYVAAYIQRHAEYQDLVAGSH